ncbi:protein hedgehog [Stomoxys calcitrans]|uniref:Hedgehog protein n=1 Tax=Stomoxys calcitrans TaxID=35570 RepID=A0A1I8P2X2_STOCA|nr:protein hedgehog [Stomoxys calcitrans]
MEYDQRVPCIEGTTDMSCDKCHICANSKTSLKNTNLYKGYYSSPVDCPKTDLPNLTNDSWTKQFFSSNSNSISNSINGSSALTLRRICILLLVASLFSSAAGCGPGRGIGGPRRKRKLTPLVFKQHVPNMSEQTLGASGVSEGAIQRESAKFKKLEFNNNRDIIFKDEEGTGADHVMTRRCKEKLNTLAISVMNQWPGVRLRVTESWDEEYLHDANSLHYEGRAVDITTSDRDRSKYGMLARLAVEAGFDWVYYETRAHIHCSVKSDSYHSPHDSGCFTKDSTVLTETGERKAMTDLSIGDRVLSINEQGQAIYSEIILFLDRNLQESQEFVQLTTESGAVLTVTPGHLVMIWNREKSLNEYVFADRVQEDDQVFVHDSTGAIRPQRVVELRAVLKNGFVAPLTKEGTIVVNSVAASCYAIINSQSLAHWTYAPMRLWSTIKSLMPHSKEGKDSTAQLQNGVHWYGKALYGVKNYVVPKSWRH